MYINIRTRMSLFRGLGADSLIIVTENLWIYVKEVSNC